MMWETTHQVTLSHILVECANHEFKTSTGVTTYWWEIPSTSCMCFVCPFYTRAVWLLSSSIFLGVVSRNLDDFAHVLSTPQNFVSEFPSRPTLRIRIHIQLLSLKLQEVNQSRVPHNKNTKRSFSAQTLLDLTPASINYWHQAWLPTGKQSLDALVVCFFLSTNTFTLTKYQRPRQ